MKRQVWIPICLCLLVSRLLVSACIWDSTTLTEEETRHPKLADVILNAPPAPENPEPLRARIKNLNSNPGKDDPAWWNDLAGTHIRLGEPQAAAELLETVTNRFPNDYGIHANLGTAYHLLGRYAEAEREIARDLELNPDAHFGLEKYHLALLQYLIRDDRYKSRHVYVDEFTSGFLLSDAAIFHSRGPIWSFTNDVAQTGSPPMLSLAQMEHEAAGLTDQPGAHGLSHALAKLAGYDTPPAYMAHWNLEENKNLDQGVLYMASLNPKEPACFEMLGLVCANQRDFNLEIAAFEKAIALGSLKSNLLTARVQDLRSYKQKSMANGAGSTALVATWVTTTVMLSGGLLLGLALCLKFRRRRK